MFLCLIVQKTLFSDFTLLQHLSPQSCLNTDFNEPPSYEIWNVLWLVSWPSVLWL